MPQVAQPLLEGLQEAAYLVWAYWEWCVSRIIYLCTIFSGTPAQIARTDDTSVLNSDTSSRMKNTPNDQSMRRSIQDLVFSIDPNVKIEPEVEDVST